MRNNFACHFTDVELSNDILKLQQLPVLIGGLGVHPASCVAMPACTASVIGSCRSHFEHLALLIIRAEAGLNDVGFLWYT